MNIHLFGESNMELCGEISSRGEATDGDGVRIDLQIVKNITLCTSGAGEAFINGILSIVQSNPILGQFLAPTGAQ